MAQLPLVVLDTNVLMDVWLNRGANPAVLLLTLSENRDIDLIIPGMVLAEFRGTALRHVSDARRRLAEMRQVNRDWLRSGELVDGPDLVKRGCDTIDQELERLRGNVDPFLARLRRAATERPHSVDVHFRGDVRFISGLPPDKPKSGIQDCRIFEAVLEIAREDATISRPKKVFATRDGDFDYPELKADLASLGFEIREDVGRVYGELLALKQQ